MVLLVDDNATIRNVIKIYLMGLDLVFLEADRAEAALEILRSARVQLILADNQMPGMDGIAFVEHVRRDTRISVRTIPILLLTGDKSADLEARGRAAGANEFIAKPVSNVQLRAAVTAALSGSAGGQRAL